MLKEFPSAKNITIANLLFSFPAIVRLFKFDLIYFCFWQTLKFTRQFDKIEK
jgi:hypothetical protein